MKGIRLGVLTRLRRSRILGLLCYNPRVSLPLGQSAQPYMSRNPSTRPLAAILQGQPKLKAH